MSSLFWLTTSPNPRSPSTGVDAGQRGWKLHAVMVEKKSTTFKDVKHHRALCGLLPSHGWGLDLFIDDKCSRCERMSYKLSHKL